MSLKKQECYTLQCDGCTSQFDWDFVPHFDTAHQALEYVLDTDGAVVAEDLRFKTFCEGCTTVELHERSLDVVDMKKAFGVPLNV